MKDSEAFRNLLAQAIHRIRACEAGKPVNVVQDELGHALGKKGAGTAIAHWRKGNLPAMGDLDKLARELIKRSDLPREWLHSFLDSAGYPHPHALCDELFPAVAEITPLVHLPSASQELLLAKTYRVLLGRAALVNEILAVLNDPDARRIVSIDGIGGIGKTSLAQEVMTLVQKTKLFSRIIWVSAAGDLADDDNPPHSNSFTFQTMLNAIGRDVGIAEVAQLPAEKKATQIRAALRRQRVLIVVDNLETADEPATKIAQRLQPLLGSSKALFTSRQRFIGDFYTIHLDGLLIEAAQQLIRQEAKDRRITVVDHAAQGELEQIIHVTGGSPLAMKLVVGQLTLLPLAQVLANLQRTMLLRQAGNDDAYADLFRSIYLPSWQRLPEAARNLLLWLAIFPQPAGSNFSALRSVSGWDDVELNTQLRQLWQVSFLETNHLPAMGLEGNRYFLHALTHYFVKSDVVKVTLSTQAHYASVHAAGAKRYVDYFLGYLSNNKRDYAWLDAEADNLVEAVRLAAQQAEPLRFVQATQRLVNYLLVRGSYIQAQQLLQLARQLSAEAGLRAELTTILTLQGRILSKQGLLEEARSVLQTALAYATAEQDAGLVADVRQASAELALNLSDFAAALADLHEVLIYVRQQNDQGRLTYVLYLLGRSACFTSELQQAQVFLNQAAMLARPPADAELMIPILIQLAGLAGMQAEYGKAENHAREALQLAESINHREWTATALKNLAGALIAQGNIEAGTTYARRGIDIAQQIGQLELASGLLNNLAVGVSNDGYLHNELAKIEEGLQYYLDGLEIVREQGNLERIRGFLTNAALILVFLGRHYQAESYLVEANAIAQTLESEWSLADTKIAWGKLLVAQGKFAQAAQAFQIALDNAERAAIPEIQADARWGLAQVAEGQKNYPEAKSFGLAALQLMEEIQLNTDASALRDWLDKLPEV